MNEVVKDCDLINSKEVCECYLTYCKDILDCGTKLITKRNMSTVMEIISNPENN